MMLDYLIIGQGISGTFLSYYLEKENKSFLVIDNGDPGAASRVAAGIINPVTGRRMVTVWMADEVLPFAWKSYNEIGQMLGINAISQKSIIDFFPNPFMRESFLKRIEENDGYVHSYPEQNKFNSYFNYEFGCGEIRPAYTVHLETLIPTWRDHLEKNNRLLEEGFDSTLLELTGDQIRYKEITATAIIYCDGVNAATEPMFQALPFAPNKGESLLLEIPDLPTEHVYKRSMMLTAMGEPDLFWLGSVYQWEYDTTAPTPGFRDMAEQLLQQWVKVPYKIVEHRASVRPATLERRPFVGLHPLHKNVGILNGMGTKGCSLAPFFARQLSDHLIYRTGIRPDADVARFAKILSR